MYKDLEGRSELRQCSRDAVKIYLCLIELGDLGFGERPPRKTPRSGDHFLFLEREPALD